MGKLGITDATTAGAAALLQHDLDDTPAQKQAELKAMFRTWNIISDLLSDDIGGHYLWEPKLLVEELLERGKAVRVAGHRSIKADQFPGALTIPAFALHHEATVSNYKKWEDLENFVVHNLDYQKGLNGLDPGMFPDALTLMLDVSHEQLLGTIRWFSRFEASRRPNVAIILQGLFSWPAGNRGLQLLRDVWSDCPPFFKEKVKVCSRSEMAADRHAEFLGERPHVLPLALGPTEKEIRRSRERVGPQDAAMIVSFLAGARLERGAALVPEVVKQSAAFGVRFMIQAVERATSGPGSVRRTIAADSLRVLKEHPSVRFHEGPLPRDEYNDWIAQSVVLLPYSPDRYKSRPSGVYLEAKGFGAPVIVPAGTWMAEEVARLRNGLVFEEYSVESIVRCIAQAQTELPALRQRAMACAAQHQREHGADRCVDAIEALFDVGPR
jgi:glycosyltransferase involved in cell wall biosynthesis